MKKIFTRQNIDIVVFPRQDGLEGNFIYFTTTKPTVTHKHVTVVLSGIG